MKFTFLTNYLTHHQLPFCEEMYARLGDDFHVLTTNPMEEERIRMGWGAEVGELPYHIYYEDNYGIGDVLVEKSEVVLCGGTDDYYLRNRLPRKLLTFRNYERLYKKGRIHAFTPKSYIRKYKQHTRYNRDPVYLLCSGAYVAGDFRLFFSYPKKMLKWGYFPAFREYSEAELARKTQDRLKLLWTGRMLDWKHPERAVYLLKDLKDAGISCELTLVGEGEMLKPTLDLVKDCGLTSDVTHLPFIKPQEVREYMLDADLYLMTSDQEEGWGAVVNEAMNAGCVVVGSMAAGAVPYLIQNGLNGVSYPYEKGERGRRRHLEAVLPLCQDAEKRARIGREAYRTIAEEWNASVAAERFITFAKAKVSGESISWEHGPMSLAK